MNREEVERLHADQGPRLLSDAMSLIRDGQAAEDIVQDIFKSLAANPGLNLQDPVAYCSTAMRNGVLRWRERAARGRKQLTFEEPIWIAPPELSEMRAAVEAALGKVTFEHREVVQLVHWQELSKPEIARRLGLPLSTIESRYKHALEKLEPLLADCTKESEV